MRVAVKCNQALRVRIQPRARQYRHRRKTYQSHYKFLLLARLARARACLLRRRPLGRNKTFHHYWLQRCTRTCQSCRFGGMQEYQATSSYLARFLYNQGERVRAKLTWMKLQDRSYPLLCYLRTTTPDHCTGCLECLSSHCDRH